LIVTGMTRNIMKSILRKGEFLKKLSPAVLISMFLLLVLSVSVNAAPFIGDCQVLPSNNIWNTPVDKLPVDLKSSAYISSIGSNSSVHPDFGSGNWNGGPIGIPFNVVLGTQPMVPIIFDYDDESDPGPYPIPQYPFIEWWRAINGRPSCSRI